VQSRGGKPSGETAQSVVEVFGCERHTVLHPARLQGVPGASVSDVDCIVPAEFLPCQLARLLRANRDRLGAAVVQWIQHESTAHYFVLAADGLGAPWNSSRLMSPLTTAGMGVSSTRVRRYWPLDVEIGILGTLAGARVRVLLS